MAGKKMTLTNKKTGERFTATIYTVSERARYYGKRSKKGTKDRNGNKLSSFRRGQYLGKSQGLGMGARIAKRYKKRRQY